MVLGPKPSALSDVEDASTCGIMYVRDTRGPGMTGLPHDSHTEVFMRLSTLVLTMLALAATESVATAAPGKAPDPQKAFARKDANSDGSLTLDEYKTGMKDKQLEKADKRFKKIDTNGDGKVSFDEFKAGMPKPKE